MSNDNPLHLVRDANAEWERLSRSFEQGGGGGGGGSMEWRVNKLEQQFEALRDDNQKLRVEMAVLNERVAHLPSKEYMVKIALGSLAFLTAIIMFADRIKAMIH